MRKTDTRCNTRTLKALLVFVSLLAMPAAKSQITVTPGVSAAAMMNSLVGAGVIVTNPVIVCNANAYGTFTGNTGTGITNGGVILTSGNAAGAVGPNTIGWYSGSYCCGTYNDPQLTGIQPGANKDVCRLEFDITPTCPTLSINYTFGSDEYPEWITPTYNDAFGFFVWGPNPLGGNYNGTNIATLPSGQAVMITTVNATTNAAYYINNTPGAILQYDGLTNNLVATVNVVPCQTYHMKIIIADGGDWSYDSGVMLNYQGLACNSAFAATPNSTPAVCGQNNGTASVTVTGGTGPFSYSWTPGGQTTASITGLAPGTYTCTINDGLACTPPVVVNVVVGNTGTPPIPSIATVNATCGCNGTLTASATGGTAPYSYSWSGGLGTNAVATNVCPGTYTVTVTGANGCTATSTATVTGPTNLTATATGTNINCFGACNGSAMANPSGGNPPYTYSWAPGGQTTQTAGGLCPGTYTVTVTATGGCTTTANVTITQPTQITGTLNITPPLCNGQCNGSVTVNASGGTGALQYSLNGGPFQASNTFTGLCNGPIIITVRDANNCTITLNGNVVQPPVLTASATNGTATCGNNNGIITATGSGGTGALTYDLNPGPGPQASGTFTGLAPGSYTVVVADANGCTVNATATVTAAPAPTLSVATQTNLSCFGGANGSVLLALSGGTAPITYTNAGPTAGGPQASNQFNNLTAGNYTATSTDGNGCTATVNYTITAPTQLTYTSVMTPVTCNGVCDGQIALTPSGGTPPYQFSSNNGLSFQLTSPLTGLCAGNTLVVVQDANGCLANSTVNVTQPAAITATFVNTDPVCFGGNNGQIVVNASGGSAPYQYSANGGPLQASNTLTGLSAGTITILVQDANGCQFTTTQTLNNPPQINITLVSTSPSNCGFSDGGFTVNATGPNAIVSYNIGFGAQPTGVFTFLVGGPYNVVVTDALGCQNSMFVAVNDVQMSATINSTTDATCFGVCDGTVSVSNVGGGPPISYELDNLGSTQPSGVFNGLCAGQHIVTVYDGGFCVASVVFTINEPTQIAFATNVVDVACNGGSTGQIDFINVTGGTPGPGYQYSIDNGTTFQASPNFTGLAQGTYNLIVMDGNTCTVSGTATISQATPITYVVNINDLTCFGNSSGFLQIVPSGGAGSYTYQVTGLQGAFGPNFTFPNIAANTYNFTIQDGSGCQVTGSGTVNEPTAVAAAYVVTPATCNGVCDGMIQINASGGTPGYLYSSDNGITYNTNSLLTNLCDGNYQIMVQDDNNCLVGSVQSVGEPTALTLTAVSTPSTCGTPNGTITLTAGGGTPGYNYSSDNGATFVAGNTFTGLAGALYNIGIEDANGCQLFDTITVDNQPSPSIIAVFTTDPTCNNACDGEINVTSFGGTGAITYDIGGAGQGTGAFTGVCPGNYTVTITDGNGCTDTQPVTVVNPTPVTITTSSTNLLCYQDFSGSITINASGGAGGYQYSIDNGGTFTAGGLFTILPIGTYNIVVQDANGCQATGQEILTEPTPMVINSVVVTNPTCFLSCDGQTTVNVSGGTVAALYTYNWSGSIAGSNQNTAINICDGTYAVSIIDDNGCQLDTSFTVTDPPQVVLMSVTSTDALCFGDCNGTITMNVTNATQYSSDNGATYQASSNFTGLCAGTYQLVAADNNLCSVSTTWVINEPAPLIANPIPADTSCYGGDYYLLGLGNGGTTPYTFNWSNTASTFASQIVYPTAQTTYTYSITDANGCVSAPVSTVIDVYPQFTVTPSSDTLVCPGGSAVLSATGSNGLYPYYFEWSNGFIDYIATTSSTTVTPGAPGSYTVTAIDNCADSVVLTINVGWHPLPTPIVTSSPSGCGPLDVTFTNSTPPNMVGTNCTWSISNGASGASCTTFNTTLFTPGTYDATLTITSPEGCTNDSTFIAIVEVYPDPVANFSWTPITPTILNGNVTFSDLSLGSTSWNWDFAGLGTSSAQNPTFDFTQLDTGQYLVCQMVATQYGCLDTICQYVTIYDELLIYVPNTFTPDGDGLNDIFLPSVRGIDPADYELLIFDRWGELLFQNQLYDQGWDGTYRGQKVKQDVYVWKLKVKNKLNEEKKEYIGHVNLLR